MEVFKLFCTLVKPHFTSRWFESRLSLENTMLMFLMQIKEGMDFEILALFFGISSQACSTDFMKMLSVLSRRLTEANLIRWPSRKEIDQLMPKVFKNDKFCDTRVVVGCVEIEVQKQTRYAKQARFLNCNYTREHTAKFILGKYWNFLYFGHFGKSTKKIDF